MGDCSTDKDLLLVKACLSGSEQSWADLWSRYNCLVRKIVMEQKQAWKASYPGVEDVVQDVFVELIHALARFDGDYAVRKFIAGVAKRTSRDKFRQAQADKRRGDTTPIDHHDGEAGFIQIKAPDHNPLQMFIETESRGILRDGMKELNDKCFNLLTLRFYEERPVKEVSEIMNMKENTATVDIKRCLEKLRANCHKIIRKGCKK